MNAIFRNTALITLLFAGFFAFTSCGTEADNEPPVPVIESLIANPPTVVPGDTSHINIGINYDDPPPNSYTYYITILDGGSLSYERDGFGSFATGPGATMELESGSRTLIVDWTAPDSAGQYAFSVGVENSFIPDITARDTLTIVVSQ